MHPTEFDKPQREKEWFHGLTVPAGMWAIIRVDGRSFTKLSSDLHLERPYDERFSRWMEEAAIDLLEVFDGAYAYSQSDEISLVLEPSFDIFKRSVEKLVSISAATASVAFSQEAGTAAYFDSRIWIGANRFDVIDYMAWRQADAARNAINSWCYWTMRKSGLSARAADSALRGKALGYKHDYLMSQGINFNDLPAWQRRGFGAWWIEYEKQGFNPITNETVMATRRKIHVHRVLPMKDTYRGVVSDILDGLAYPDDMGAIDVRALS